MHSWLVRRYAVLGRRYVALCAWAAVAEVVFAMTPVSTAVTARYEGLSVGQWAVSMAVALPLIALSLGVAAFACRGQLRLVSAWAGGARTGLSAQDVAAATHKLPRRLFVVAASVAFVTALPAGIYGTLRQTHRLHPADFAVLYVAGFFFSVWGIVLLWVWGEVTMRPVLLDLARAEPSVNVGRPGRGSMTWKLAIALGSAMVVGACYGGALTADPGQPTASLVRLVGVTLGVSAAFGLLLVPIFASMLLQPISDLTVATRDVARGDLHRKVAVIGNDEIGELELSFNAMVDVLHERGELRAHNELLVAELQESLARLVRAGDTARRRVERDLHDGAQQQITLIGLKLRMLQQRPHAVGDDAALLDELQEDVRTALRELRDLAHGVFPAELDEGGLAPALRFALARSGLPYELDCRLERRHRPELELALYFTCLEAVQNIAKHAGPGVTARVLVRECDDVVELEVADDGLGFDNARDGSPPSGSGLQGIADRVGALGGALGVTSAVNEGTVLRARVPI